MPTMTTPDPYTQAPVASYGAAPAYSQDYRPVAPTNVLAIVSLVTSLVGIHLAGIITGHIALKQIARTGEQGKGMAQAGLIIGYVLGALTFLFVIGYIVFFFVLFAAAGASTLSYY
jgi:hypothetical protein